MVLLWPGHRASALPDALPQGDVASHDGRAGSQTPGGMVGVTVDGAVPQRVRSWEPSRPGLYRLRTLPAHGWERHQAYRAQGRSPPYASVGGSVADPYAR